MANFTVQSLYNNQRRQCQTFVCGHRFTGLKEASELIHHRLSVIWQTHERQRPVRMDYFINHHLEERLRHFPRLDNEDGLGMEVSLSQATLSLP